MRTATGEVSLSLSGSPVYLTSARSDLNHIATDGYIGVATKTVGDKQVALDVLIFPPPLKGAAEGHFPWDKLPDTTLGRRRIHVQQHDQRQRRHRRPEQKRRHRQ